MSDTTTNKGEELYQSKIEEVNKERLYSREEKQEAFSDGLYSGIFSGVLYGITATAAVLWIVCFLTNTHFCTN